MCGGGGMSAPGPTPEEQRQTELQNQLLQQQLADEARQRAEEEYKQTPAYLNQQLAQTRTKQQADFNNSKNAAYQQAKKNIIDQFTAFGDPNAAAPYLQALDQQYGQLGYHSGGDYGYNTSQSQGRVPVSRENFNEQAFLAANPDVAASYGFASGDPSYYQSGEDFLNRTGEWGKRTIDGTVTNQSLASPGADTWDDPNVLLNSDYGAGQYITSQRQGRKDTAFNTAKQNAQTVLAGMGLDQGTYDQLWNQTNNQLQNKYNTAGLSSNDYSNVFDPQAVLDSVFGTARTARRTQYGTAVNSAFGSIDPNSDFADTADDPYISNIVGKQYGDAFSALDRAYKRGALTDTGFNSGKSYLDDQNKTALSSAQSLGGAVLQKDRDALGGIVSGAKTAATGWDFGQNFDVNKYLTDYSTKKGSLAGSLEGDVTNALAGQNWFDVGDVLNKAGYAQGAQNTAPLTEGYSTPAGLALAGQREKDKNAQRGLGGTGVF